MAYNMISEEKGTRGIGSPKVESAGEPSILQVKWVCGYSVPFQRLRLSSPVKGAQCSRDMFLGGSVRDSSETKTDPKETRNCVFPC